MFFVVVVQVFEYKKCSVWSARVVMSVEICCSTEVSVMWCWDASAVRGERLSFLSRAAWCHHHRENWASVRLVAQRRFNSTQCESWQERSGPAELGDVHLGMSPPVPASLTRLSVLLRDALFERTVTQPPPLCVFSERKKWLDAKFSLSNYQRFEWVFHWCSTDVWHDIFEKEEIRSTPLTSYFWNK